MPDLKRPASKRNKPEMKSSKNKKSSKRKRSAY